MFRMGIGELALIGLICGAFLAPLIIGGVLMLVRTRKDRDEEAPARGDDVER